MIKSIIAISVLMSVLGFVLMMLDKSYARRRKSRIKESTFALITLFGGMLGILLGSLSFSHKTMKRSFQFKMIVMFTIYIVMVFALLRSVNL